MKKLLAVLFILSYLLVNAQSGELTITDDYEEDYSESPIRPIYLYKTSVQLFYNGERISLEDSSKFLHLPYTIKHLKSGTYVLNILNDDTLFISFHKISIKENTNTEIRLNHNLINT